MRLVKQRAGESEVTIYNLNERGMDKARQYGVTSVPTVVIDGKVLDCCEKGKLTADHLKAAGIDTPRG